MNVDKRLEELAAIKGGREYVMTRVLIAALLRARKREREIHSYADGRQTTAFQAKDREVWRDIERMTRGADAELEELLR